MVGLIVRIATLTLVVTLQGSATGQTGPDPAVADLCDVVASPARYNHKLLSLEGILLLGDHSVLLYSASCKPREGFDVGIQAVFPPDWVLSPNGKQLREFLHRGKSAGVKLVGTFESDSQRYGPDVARFRFTIREITSVKRALSNGP